MRKDIIWIVTGVLSGIVLTIITYRMYENNRSEAAYGYALSLIESGERNRALGVLHESIAINPGNYRPYITIGTLYEKNGDYKLALEYYIHAMGLIKNNERALNLDGKFLKNKIESLKRFPE